MASDPLRALLEAAREGDDVAVHRLIVETQGSVRRLCSVLGSRDSVDDLVQDTYLRALRSIDRFRGDAPVLAWLLSIARRVCADDVRHLQRARRVSDRVKRTTVAPTTAGIGIPVDDLIDRLDPDRREAFLLTQYVGLSYDDAATVLDCPVGTVRSRVSRARSDLMAWWRAAEAQ